MTKIKNTKKGMAKKTLSMSLVVAMLATSNVPVWAAEFSDGTDAVFTAEAEAPVVEDNTTDTVEAQAVDSKYTLDIKDLKSDIAWGTWTTVKIKITDNVSNENVTNKMQIRLIESGKVLEATDADATSSEEDENGYHLYKLNIGNKFLVGQRLQLQVYEGTEANMTWVATSPEFTVAKKSITGSVTFKQNTNDAVRYTGSQITTAPSEYEVTYTGAKDTENIELGNWTVTGDNTVDSWNVSNKELKATADIVSKYYTGTVSGNFEIWRKAVDSADDAATAELPAYEYEYTGSDITIAGKEIIITNKATNQVVNDAANDFTIGKDVGTKKNIVPVDMTKGTLKNFALKDKDDKDFVKPTLTLSKDVKITARDLTNTANTTVSINTVTEDTLTDSKINADNLKSANLVIKDITGNNLMGTSEFANKITLEFENGAKELKVEPGKTYKAIIKGDGKSVTGERTVEFTVVAHNLNNAKFAKEPEYAKDKTYTGEQITCGLTADNLVEKLGNLTLGSTTLLAGTDYDVNVEFGENTNVGKGQIIINGKGSYAGSKKVIEFNINARDVEDANVVVPKKVVYDPSITDVADYKLETSIVVKFKENDKEYSVTVPAADYKVEYTGTNKVGEKITTTITRTNNKSNFNFNKVTGGTVIANKAIADADVTLNKTEYTYTGKAIIPDYTVTVDGTTLVKGTDYTETVVYNTEVGEATLTVTGKGEYDTTSVVKKFNIVAADISDLTVVGNATIKYDGTQHVGDKTTSNLVIKLGDTVISSDQFTVTYPLSKTANINAGDGTVTLKPAKDNKNFIGEKEFTFTIGQATLKEGNLIAYDKNGTKVNIDKATFTYDETAHEFDKLVYNNTVKAPMVLTADDYEIVYKDNVKGDKDEKGHVLVIAKGNYKAEHDYTTADNEKVENVVLNKEFKINNLDISNEDLVDVSVENGMYNAGFDVAPIVAVSYKGKTLVEGVDYELSYDKTEDRKNVTNGKTLSVKITGIGGYKGAIEDKKWGIDKFNLANAEIIVVGTDVDPVVKVLNNGTVVDEKDYDLTVADGKATVSAKADSKNYTGSQSVDIKQALVKPEAPMISNVKVVGNKATVVLSEESEGAMGYDYVISTDRDCINNKAYDAVNKNQIKTETTFDYVGQGTYYAYCHAWTRDEDGKKVFSDWSNAYPFAVSAITPSQPTITSVKVDGSTVTVTYTGAENAEGYDVVLGTSSKKVNGEVRPVNYGKLVKKNQKTTTVTFKNVEKGTYYVGLHAFNKTSEDGKKVFSQWSNVKKATVK